MPLLLFRLDHRPFAVGFFLCQPLERASYARLFPALLEDIGCNAPLALRTAKGNRPEGVESGSLRRADGTVLAYVNNLRRAERRVTLSCDAPIRSVRNLSTGEDIKPSLRLPPLECWILEIDTE